MNANLTEIGMREASTTEMRSVAGGWGTVTGGIIMHLLADWGATSEKQEAWVASLPPSRKP